MAPQEGIPTPYRPWFAKALNVAGEGIFRLGWKPPRLEETELIRQARRATGLEDFGDEGFRPGLRVFLAALEKEANLNLMGRLMAQQNIRGYLKDMLQFEDFHKQHPDLRQQEIRQPLFILGLPRTGTTILFNLLAQDQRNRVPMAWEVSEPMPPPRAATYHCDPRIARCRKRFAMLDRLSPGLKAIHEFGAELPQECVQLYEYRFLSIISLVTHRVPGYYRWVRQQDLLPALRFHKQFLQHLQYYHQKERWVLKSPIHLNSIEELLTVYPDARIVQTHRHPLQVIPSMSSLAYALQQLGSDRVDPKEVGQQQLEMWGAALRRAVAARQKFAVRGEQFCDVRFEEVLKDPIAVVARIYGHFGIPFLPEAERAMTAFLRDNPQGKHGKHRYSLEMFGLDAQRDRHHFADYCAMFNLAG